CAALRRPPQRSEPHVFPPHPRKHTPETVLLRPGDGTFRASARCLLARPHQAELQRRLQRAGDREPVLGEPPPRALERARAQPLRERASMSARRLAPKDLQPGSFAFTAENLAWAKAQIAKYPEGRQASAVIPI